MAWTLVMTLGFPRKKLPVSEENKVSLKENADCSPGQRAMRSVSALPYYVAFEARNPFSTGAGSITNPLLHSQPRRRPMWSLDSALPAPRDKWTHCSMGFPLG